MIELMEKKTLMTGEGGLKFNHNDKLQPVNIFINDNKFWERTNFKETGETEENPNRKNISTAFSTIKGSYKNTNIRKVRLKCMNNTDNSDMDKRLSKPISNIKIIGKNKNVLKSGRNRRVQRVKGNK